VANFEELKKQAGLIVNTYKQPALVEEFISGQEFTVAILGNDNPEALPVVQVEIDGSVDLGDKFYTFARISSDRLKYVCPARISKDLTKKIQEMALRAYQSVDCLDFGRVDFRVDAKGQPYVLEINPLPCLSTEDVFQTIANVIGISYSQMLGRILNCALDRYGLN
jgi:D-alanine-D-alanine ligase